MTGQTRPGVAVAGGAGFLGSHIAKRFHRAGYAVTVIDGLMERTGGREQNLHPILSEIQFYRADIRDLGVAAVALRDSDVVIDCMAWTDHRSALRDPLYDLRLNAETHLHLLHHLRAGQQIIYLGSRSQYGRQPAGVITEETAMIPVDVQGIHKLAAESYFRVFSRLNGMRVISLRFPNCFGQNQPIRGDDIGLVGGLIRELLVHGFVEVFGEGRKRFLVYAQDLADVVLSLVEKATFGGFETYNMAGTEVSIEALAQKLIELVGHGTYALRAAPDEIASMDVGNGTFNDHGLRAAIGDIPTTELDPALRTTIEYFKENL